MTTVEELMIKLSTLEAEVEMISIDAQAGIIDVERTANVLLEATEIHYAAFRLRLTDLYRFKALEHKAAMLRRMQPIVA